MERKEPCATQEEFNRRVVRYQEVPVIEGFPAVKSHLVSTERLSVLFVTMEPNAQVPIYHHEAEQNKVVMDGATDEIVDGNKQ